MNNLPLFTARIDTIHVDTTGHYTRPDTARTAHLVRVNTALKSKVDSLESTLAGRVTIGLLLLLAIVAAKAWK